MPQNIKICLIRTLKLLAILVPALLFVLFFPANDWEDSRRIHDFYLEEEDSLDVVVMGASDVYAGFSPVLAYEEYGFTSFVYAMSGNYLQLFQGQLEEILRVQSPELIVIDITEAAYDKGNDYDTVFRQFIAGVPFSQHKIDLIREHGDPENQLSYYIPFIASHGNTEWGYIKNGTATSAAVRQRGYSLLKGSLTFTGSGENWDGPYVEPINTTNDHSTAEIPRSVAENFETFLSYLKDNGHTNVLFVSYPQRRANEERYHCYKILNAVGELIRDHGFAFVNLESRMDDIGIQSRTDFYNNDHLNLYGQYKVTRYLCDILVKDYGVAGRTLSPLTKERWDTCAEYQRLYYTLFDYEFQSRDPDEFGMWMKEEAWLYSKLDDMKQNGCPTP